jgi:hypothetical protein
VSAEAPSVVGLDHHQRDALGTLLRIGLGDDHDQVGVLAVGDEGLGAVENVTIALFHRGGAHVLQVGAGARLAHRDGADHLAARQLRQPALLLLLGAEPPDVGRDDAGMQRRAEAVEAAEAVGAVDDGLVRKAAAGAAVFLRDHRAQQARLPGLGPGLARIHVRLVPLLEVRRVFGLHEAVGLLFQQDQVFRHPRRARHIDRTHGCENPGRIERSTNIPENMAAARNGRAAAATGSAGIRLSSPSCAAATRPRNIREDKQ